MNDEGTLGPLVPLALYKEALRERDRLRAVVKSVEWVQSNTFAGYRCPVCMARRDLTGGAHIEGCELWAALGGRP